MTSGSEEYNKSTNPSSQNSSFDQLHQLRTKPEEYTIPENPYAKEIQFNQISPTVPLSPYGMQDLGYGQQMPPSALPPKEFTHPAVNNPRQPIKLDGITNISEITPPASPKKQSWLKRRFSKRAS